jgi:nickel-dependent lactate racemase
MEIKLPYGKTERALRVPDSARVDFLGPREAAPIHDLPEAFARACRNPVGGAPLDEMAKTATDAVILVSDLTRSRGAEVVLPLCISYLDALGIRPASIRILVARGTHRKLSKTEKAFFRKGPLAGITLEEHDCDDPERLSALVLTRRGTPVRVNIALKDAGVVIVLAPVSFHYFAGFGGGRKLILPGCADRHAILANHRLSLVDGRTVKLHPSCRPGVLEGNPVHEDMCETVSALSRVFCVNYFADRSGDIVYLNAGDILRSHAAACEAYREAHAREVPDPYPVLVLSAGGHPFDVNFLQGHKPLRHASSAVRKGGAVLYFAECAEGVGSSALESALRRDKSDFLKNAFKEYDLNNQTAVSLHDLASRFEIAVVSEVSADVVAACGMRPCETPEAFLADAMERRRADRIAVIHEGHNFLPRIGPGGRL